MRWQALHSLLSVPRKLQNETIRGLCGSTSVTLDDILDDG